MAEKTEKLLLVVVAKAPVAGSVKTRLIPHLTPVEAAELYRCFLQDRILTISALRGVDLAIAYTPKDAREAFSRYACNGLVLFAQQGEDLGERLNNIFAEKLADGYDAVSVVDSDSPDLPGSAVQQSFDCLMSGQADVVFGPCHDGGYYLVGMRRPHPQLFDDIPWSTGTVLADTLEKAQKIGARTELLPWWNDLDTIADLAGFYRMHQHAAPENDWAGKTTFCCLVRLERVRRRFLSSG